MPGQGRDLTAIWTEVCGLPAGPLPIGIRDDGRGLRVALSTDVVPARVVIYAAKMVLCLESFSARRVPPGASRRWHATFSFVRNAP